VHVYSLAVCMPAMWSNTNLIDIDICVYIICIRVYIYIRSDRGGHRLAVVIYKQYIYIYTTRHQDSRAEPFG